MKPSNYYPSTTPPDARRFAPRQLLRGGALLALGTAAVLLSLALLSGCSRDQGASATQVTVAGSTSVTPFAEQLAEKFMAKHAGVRINIQGIGSSAGIQATETGASDIGMSSRGLKAEEEKVLQPVTIALDALAIIVHPDNPVQNLTLDQVKRVFAGQITNWREVGGPNAAITLVNREAGSGTRGAFEELVMGKDGPPLSDGAIRQGSNGAVRAVVAGDPEAIGYISLGIVDASVRALRVDGAAANSENIHAGRYRLVRPFLFVMRRDKQTGKLGKEYLSYVLGDEGQRILVNAGLIAAPRKELPWKG